MKINSCLFVKKSINNKTLIFYTWGIEKNTVKVRDERFRFQEMEKKEK